MSESPSQRRPGTEHGPSPSRASVPPSEPRPTSRASFSAIEAQVDRPARLQMIVAMLLGLVLVAIPLYLWRRPRAESIAVTTSPEPGQGTLSMMDPPAQPEPRVVLAEPKVLACQDPGPKKTPPEQCDRLTDVEKALAKAIEESAACVPAETTGSIVYVADVSFRRKTVGVYTPRDGRTIKTTKVVASCQAQVKGKLHGFSLASMPHEHARYKIAVAATYRAAKP